MKCFICMATMAVLIPPVVLAAPSEVQHPPRLGGPLVDGSVVRARGCGSHFFIAYRNEYALAAWLGGEMVKENDVLQTTDDQANFEREGRMTLTNLATGRAVDIVIEKALMNRADYSTTSRQVCR
jgi:hypothetical protein